MQTKFEQLIDEVAALHLEDYSSVLLKYIPVLDLAVIVHNYCLDEMAFETALFTKLATIGYGVPPPEDLNIKNAKARNWANCLYQLCAGHMDKFFNTFNIPPEWIWNRILSPSMHRVKSATECIRPQCFWRMPPECICNQPIFHSSGTIIPIPATLGCCI